jgi:riboflavin biosynthesis pyrimidine reductase
MANAGTSGSIARLYPELEIGLPLVGTYLAHDVRKIPPLDERPYFYANFIQSMDGRISVAPGPSEAQTIPGQIANKRDWRLFQELAVQADVVLSSGRYLRDYAEGEAQEIIQIYDDSRFDDLGDWRAERGLPPYPTLGVLSVSLDFTLPPALLESGRHVLVITSETSDQARKDDLRQAYVEILECGREVVEGRRMAAALAGLGAQTVYSAAGPQVLHLLLQAGILDRLYLTTVFKLLGGTRYASIVEGELLDPPPGFRLSSLYLDQPSPDVPGQIFAAFDSKRSAG